ncbi:FG-GAP-like repeat-containing protein [Streptomyces sp. NBC_01207]|uniref:FG-GAP-like repeat-containing protein n=1 Tax=Streptomyces sp. NBC_01207 TaxID=2903772 RepID=UPI002E0EDB6C|nr:FG-GAP-like repeat-containing protein [Streptomyces sp. NBC_01207]
MPFPTRARARMRTTALSLALSLAAGGLVTATTTTAHAASYNTVREAFNNTAISADGAPGTADFDTTGRSLSATDLDKAGWRRGARVTISATTYTRADVAPGQPDNVLATGQSIAVRGAGNALGFLASATSGSVSAPVTVAYSDGTSAQHTLDVADWTAGTTATAALSLGHRNTVSGQQTAAARLYAVTVPLDPRKALTSVTLPKTGSATAPGAPALHVFDIAVRNTPAAPGGKYWAGSWGASFGSTEQLAQPGWAQQTLRMVVHPHTSGGTARIRFANTFSPQPIRLGHATVASQAATGGAAAAQVPVSLTFGGSQDTTLPAGGEIFSDPVTFPVTAGKNLLVSIYLPDQISLVPTHNYALTTSFISSRQTGDHTADTAAAAFPGTLSYWTLASGVDVAATENIGTVVALGDSQTDGAHSTPDRNQRWPDHYAASLNTDSQSVGVVNAGISANRLLTDRTDTAGPSALSRLDRDVFAQSNVRTVVLYEGINDLAHDNASADSVKDAIRRVCDQAKARGIRIVVATIPAFAGYSAYTETKENARQRVNAAIRTMTEADARTDFDLATRDPDMPSQLRASMLKPGGDDHLHFADAGTKVLADTLLRAADGPSVTMSQTTAADFNGDGNQDLVARQDSTGILKMWLGRGNGTFASSVDVTGGWRPFSQTVSADFTGDGKADLIARDTTGNLKLWAGHGNGTFGTAVTVTSGWDFTQTATADFDGNGKADLIARDASGNLKIWAGHGDGTFGTGTQLSNGWNFTQTTAADFNGDGQADIIARDTTGNLKLWTHNTAGYFNTPVNVTSGWNFSQTTSADFNGDGRTDIIARDDTTGNLRSWTGHNNTTFTSPTTLTSGW